MSEWDCIVVGAGIVGSWTAYHLATAGKHTLLIDQFILPHTRGSSAGHSRLTTNSYYDPSYGRMMSEVSTLWEQLQARSGMDIKRKTGFVLLQQEEKPGHIMNNKATLDMYKQPYEMLRNGQVEKRYEGLRHRENKDLMGLLDAEGTVLIASRCVSAVQNEFKKLGGTIHDNVKVTKVVPGRIVQLITTKETYLARNVVITSGPWVMDMLHPLGLELPIKTMPGVSVYFKVEDQSAGLYDANRFPVVATYTSFDQDKSRFVLMFPALEYPDMIKVVTRGDVTPYYCHPDERDTIDKQYMVDIVVNYIKEYIPGVNPTPKILESCMYTMTEGHDFIVDHHPVYDNVVIGAGFSGHGFARSPVVGKLLMELACKLPASYPMEPYSISRFYKSKI